MTSKELIKKAFRLEEVERIPWVPFVGSHAGDLLGLTATDFLKSEKNIVDGLSKAIELYNPDGIPVMFDLQIEAEVLGCDLIWADDNPPAVVSHPLENGIKLEELNVPKKTDGRIKTALEVTRKKKKKYPDIALYGLITGPYTLALHLMGTEIFIKMMEDPEEVQKVMEFTNKVAIAMATYYIEAGCDIIAVVDPMTSQIDPDSFNTFVTEPSKELFAEIRKLNALSSFFVCGFAQQNIEVMCQCKPDNISIDENIPLDYVKETALANEVSFGGNIKLTVSLLMGTVEDCQVDALECMDLGGKKGFILAPGCDLAMKTPVENIKAISELVHSEYQQDIIRHLQRETQEIELFDLKARLKDDAVIVDVITLDSSSCAPCQYMVEAVKNAVGDMKNVEYYEHRIKEHDGIRMMATLGVKSIPTICIDGEVKFISQIPPRQVIIDAVQEKLDKK